MIMATVFFVFISTTIILAISAMTAGTQELANQYLESRKSLYVAEAGLESAIYDRLRGNSIGPLPSIEGHTADVSVQVSGEEEILISTASWDGVERTVEARLSTGSTTEILGWKETR